MKERLDQLRAMDSAAFMALPASSFSPMPKEAVVDPEEIAAASSPYTNLNGYFPNTEGERRRKEMLDVATMLEERYRVLLPPDRVRRAPEPVLSESASRTQVQSRDGDDSETDQMSAIGEKLRLRLPARSSTSTTPAPSPAATTPTMKKPRPSTSSKQPSVIRILQTAVTTPSPPSPTLPRAEASPLSPSPTIDMDIPSSPEPEELELTPSSPLPTAVTELPQTPISNEASTIEPSSLNVPLSNGATKVSAIVSDQQNHTFPDQKRPFTPSEQDIPVTPPDQEMPAMSLDQEMPVTAPDQEMPITSLDQEMPTASLDHEVPTTSFDQEAPTTSLEMPTTSLDQEMPTTPHDQEIPATPPDQEMLIVPNEQETPSDQERPVIPDSVASILQNQEILLTPSEQERLGTPEPEGPIIRDQEVSSPPRDGLPTPLEREESILPEHRGSQTPLVLDGSGISEQEKLPPPLEERSVTPERLPPERERVTTPEPERLPTLPVPERPTTPVPEVTDQDLQESLAEKELSFRKSIEPHTAGDRESEREDRMSVRAGSEVLAPQNKPEREEDDVEPASDKMDVEEDETVAPIPTVAVNEQATTDATVNAIPDAALTEQTVLPDVPMTRESADPGLSVIEQSNVPVSEVGLNIDRPVTPKQRQYTESVDIEGERMPYPVPISSISAPRGRGRKKARLDPSIQLNESISAPVRPRVPKNHVTYIGASGEVEVTASAIMRAAVHRTQRDVTRHLNAFGVPVPNAIVQMGPDFELPEWVFPPLSPAESEHAHGDFDVIEDLELNPETPSERQMTLPGQVGKVNWNAIETDPGDYTASIEVGPVEPILGQPARQPGPKIIIPRLPPPRPESVTYEEDTVSLGDEDT